MPAHGRHPVCRRPSTYPVSGSPLTANLFTTNLFGEIGDTPLNVPRGGAPSVLFSLSLFPVNDRCSAPGVHQDAVTDDSCLQRFVCVPQSPVCLGRWEGPWEGRPDQDTWLGAVHFRILATEMQPGSVWRRPFLGDASKRTKNCIKQKS